MDGQLLDPDQAEEHRFDRRLGLNAHPVILIVQGDGDIADRADFAVGIIGGEEIAGEFGGTVLADTRLHADGQRGRIQRLGQARAGIHRLVQVDGTTGQDGQRNKQQGEDHGNIAGSVTCKPDENTPQDAHLTSFSRTRRAACFHRLREVETSICGLGKGENNAGRRIVLGSRAGSKRSVKSAV